MSATPRRLRIDTGEDASRQLETAQTLTPLQAFVEHIAFRRVIAALIFFNAIILGALTFQEPGTPGHTFLSRVDFVVLCLFVIEIGLKFIAWRMAFFKRGWYVFDLLVIGVSLVPASSSIAVMRALRVLRILRLLHIVPMMRRITEALFRAIPGMGAILAVCALLVYVAAVIATDMFGRTDNPDVEVLFGDLHSSALSLFQVMTMDGWRNEVVQKVMDDGHPYAWIFFLVFIFVGSFAVLNLFIALFVDALQTEHDRYQDERIDLLDGRAINSAESQQQMITLLESMKSEITQLRTDLERAKVTKDGDTP